MLEAKYKKSPTQEKDKMTKIILSMMSLTKKEGRKKENKEKKK